MKPVKDVVSAVSEVIERLTLPKREKRQCWKSGWAVMTSAGAVRSSYN